MNNSQQVPASSAVRLVFLALSLTTATLGAVSAQAQNQTQSGPIQTQALAGIPLTVIHTNDLHSHFRGEKTPLGLGGVARLKTAITRIRDSVANSLLVDGGDWSEGNIYYTEGAGRETLRMMDSMGYDVAVVGNHDWLNGAATLMSILEQANPTMKVIASNIKTNEYSREDEFRRRIPPYVIQEVGGAKIAFIGLLTYEFIYDKYLKPVSITEPFASTRELAKQLKKQADAVIVISHNSISINKGVLLAAPDVDLVVGAHDHVKLNEPVVVERPGAKPAWIVETGCWGRYLGRVDLLIHPRDPSVPGSKGFVDSLSYSLEQMDASVPEDRDTLRKISALEAVIESKRGPIFHDHVGDSEVVLSRDGQENLMGDFTTDAYLAASNADLALDETAFIYNEIHEGAVTSADVFNANPGIYSPETNKSWTLHLIPLPGKTLSWILNLLYTNKSLSQSGAVNFAGMDIVYNLLFGATTQDGPSLGSLLTPGHISAPGISIQDTVGANGLSISSLKIRGQELQKEKTYMVAVSGGVVQALEFLAGVLPGVVPLSQMRDTGQEDWRVMADYVTSHSPIRLETVQYGRVHTEQYDLGLLDSEVRFEPQHRDSSGRMVGRVTARVRNTGMKTSPAGASSSGPQISLLLNDHGVNFAVNPVYRQGGKVLPLPALAAGQTADLSWESVAIPETLGVYSLTAQISGNEAELNHSNDSVTRYFKANGALGAL